MSDPLKSHPLRIALVAGGTGGHIMPALSLAQALCEIEPSISIDFICGNRPVELKIYADAGINPRVLPLGGITKGGIIRRIRQSAALGYGLLRSLASVRHYQAVVGMGGYVAATVLPAAWMRGVPVAIHDSNTILGRVNRWMAPRARVIACGLPLAKIPPQVDPARIIEVGTPVRPGIGECSREEAAREFGLDPQAFTILLMAGSQGGSRVYINLLTEALIQLDKNWSNAKPLQIIWATGPQNLEPVKSAFQSNAFRGKHLLVPSIQRMDMAYAMADLFIGRSGASSLAEITLCGLPSILFPLPISAERHQYYNADAIAKPGAAIICEEDKISPDNLAGKIASLAANPEEIRRMAVAARRLARPNAAHDLAKIVLDMARKTKTR